MSFKVAVFTASLESHVVRTIVKLVADQRDLELLILYHSPQRSPHQLIRSQIKNLRKHGWRWIPYQGAELVSRASRILRAPHPQRRLVTHDATARELALPEIAIENIADVNGNAVVNRLREWGPDLGLSLAAPILKQPLFDIPRLGTLNVHKGELPRYRGMPPGFWELWNGENTVGVTVHRVEKGLDKGAILLSEQIAIARYSTPAGLRVRLDEVGVHLVVGAVRAIRAGHAVFRPQTGEGHTYTRPTLGQERELARRLSGSNPKRMLKNCIFTAYQASGRFRGGQNRRIVVLLYHRVSDALRDAVTIGVAQFDDHIRYLAAHYDIRRLEDIISASTPPSEGPVVVITFDDGYLDNYENAAPILLKHRVPATFFVSTDNVSENLPFAHDLRKLGYGLPNMSWDQIREMHAEGLSFGSHTANHTNLAQADAETAQRELVRSKATLERELGIDRVMFAYPFGKRADITPERVKQVQSVGFVCNCSAYGGVNDLQINRWDVRRMGIDHQFDPPALAARIAGWKASVYA